MDVMIMVYINMDDYYKKIIHTRKQLTTAHRRQYIEILSLLTNRVVECIISKYRCLLH